MKRNMCWCPEPKWNKAVGLQVTYCALSLLLPSLLAIFFRSIFTDGAWMCRPGDFALEQEVDENICKEKIHNWWHILSLMILERTVYATLYGFFPPWKQCNIGNSKKKKVCQWVFLSVGCLSSFLALNTRILTRQMRYDLSSFDFYPEYSWPFRVTVLFEGLKKMMDPLPRKIHILTWNFL